MIPHTVGYCRCSKHFLCFKEKTSPKDSLQNFSMRNFSSKRMFFSQKCFFSSPSIFSNSFLRQTLYITDLQKDNGSNPQMEFLNQSDSLKKNKLKQDRKLPKKLCFANNKKKYPHNQTKSILGHIAFMKQLKGDTYSE